jgi:hypothetical protein
MEEHWRETMCEWGKCEQVRLFRPNKKGRTHVPVDSCIAPIVQALQDAGIDTIASCCGHGKIPGSILFRDDDKIMGSRELIIVSDRDERNKIYDTLYPVTIGGERVHPWYQRLKVAWQVLTA